MTFEGLVERAHALAAGATNAGPCADASPRRLLGIAGAPGSGKSTLAAEPVTYAPQFRREIEEPIAGAIPVPREVPLVIVEGNYLLVDDGPWAGVRCLLDECWFVEVDEAARMDRLLARHRAFGRTPEAARAFASGSDQANAEVIAATRGRADVVVAG